MKKIVSLGMMALTLCLASCVGEVEDLFDANSQQRLEAHRSECQELLTSAPYGWLIEYFPSELLESGGYVLTAKFTADGKVTATGEMADDLGRDVTETATSHYSVLTHTGVVLSFDTYNLYLHYMSDPNYYSGNKLDGEFEFVYRQGNSKQMEFYGVKTGNRVIFRALENEEEFFDYIRKVQEISNKVTPYLYTGFTWTTPDRTLSLDLKENCNCLYYYPRGKDYDSENYSYIYKHNGIQFYEPVTLKGVTAQNFEWVEEGGFFRSIDAVNGNGSPTEVTLQGFHGEAFMHYNEFLGDWTLHHGDDSAKRATWTFKVKEEYKSYWVEGLSEWGDVSVTYSRTNGQLTMPCQDFANDGEYTVRLCPMTSKSWTYSWGGNNGFYLNHNNDAEHLELTFESCNGNPDYDAILLRRFLNGATQSYNYGHYVWLDKLVKNK